MKYTRIFGDVVMCAAASMAGAMGVAHAATGHLPRIVIALGERIENKAIAPIVAGCFVDTQVAVKPVSEMWVSDAQSVLACTDQKIVEKFMAQPAVHHALVGQTALRESGYIYTADRVTQDAKFAERVVQTCGAQKNASLREFSACAAYVHGEVSKTEFYMLAGKAAALFLICAGAAGYRREILEQRETRAVRLG